MSETDNLPVRAVLAKSCARRARQRGSALPTSRSRRASTCAISEAIEAGDNDALPAAPYSVGFVKAYARRRWARTAWRWPPSSAVAGQDQPAHRRGHPLRADRSGACPRAASPGRRRLGAGDRPCLRLLAARAVHARDARRAARGCSGGEGPAARRGACAAPEPVAPPPAPAADGPVLLTAVEPTWIRVYERVGTTLFQGELAAGQS